MNIPSKFYEITEETFNEDLKFSIHSYLNKSVLNIDEHFSSIGQAKISNVNEVDITGKFNAINFLLHIYIYQSVNRFRAYPENQDPTIDFILISKDLIKNKTSLEILDWNRCNFIENYQKILGSSYPIYRKEKSFIKLDFLQCIDNDEYYLPYLNSVKHINKLYLKNYLELTISSNKIETQKFKI